MFVMFNLFRKRKAEAASVDDTGLGAEGRRLLARMDGFMAAAATAGAAGAASHLSAGDTAALPSTNGGRRTLPFNAGSLQSVTLKAQSVSKETKVKGRLHPAAAPDATSTLEHSPTRNPLHAMSSSPIMPNATLRPKLPFSASSLLNVSLKSANTAAAKKPTGKTGTERTPSNAVNVAHALPVGEAFSSSSVTGDDDGATTNGKGKGKGGLMFDAAALKAVQLKKAPAEKEKENEGRDHSTRAKGASGSVGSRMPFGALDLASVQLKKPCAKPRKSLGGRGKGASGGGSGGDSIHGAIKEAIAKRFSKANRRESLEPGTPSSVGDWE